MKEYKGIVIALIAGICAIVCISIFSGSLVNYKKDFRKRRTDSHRFCQL